MKGLCISLFLFLTGLSTIAQQKLSNLSIQGQTSFTTPDHVPFWMRSNQYGSVPLSGPSASLIARASKDYDTTKIFDFGAALEGRANGGKGSALILVEGYGKVKLWIFEARAGRSKDLAGLADTLLSAGNFSSSGTALGVPKIQLSIPEFYTIPVFGGLISLKGNYVHGWLGNEPIKNKRVSEVITYFHQKSLWGRIGKPEWRFKLIAGFTDNAFWGNERKTFESFIMSDWETYKSVVQGKVWLGSKVGNHAGSIDVRFEYDFNKVKVAAYRQSFYEAGALYYLANIADGLNGLVFYNKDVSEKKFKWKKFLFEFLYTKNQAGETWSKPTPSGNENYMNHGLYARGWSYNGIGLGTPFITPVNLARPGQVSLPDAYFINNRLIAFHTGLAASFFKWDFITKLSYSKNFGTHKTKVDFLEVNQFSGYIDGQREIGNGLHIGGTVAFDAGKLLYNSGAALIKITKSF